MKKLVLALVAVAAISFASCNNGKTQQGPAQDTDTVAVVDTMAADTMVAE